MLEKDISRTIAGEMKIKPWQAEAVIKLTDEGSTVPFISRYRKEATGELDDEQVRTVVERTEYLRNLVKRQDDILKRIEEQGQLTPDLQAAIEKTHKLQELEDLYLPYKQKKRTRAQMAKEKGLEPLAAAMLLQTSSCRTALEAAQAFINAEKGIDDAAAALAGARDIVAETIMERADLRQRFREHLWKTGEISTEIDEKADNSQTFLMYKDYKERIHTLPSHRVLAINRGEKNGCLKVRLLTDHETNISRIYDDVFQQPSIFQTELHLAIEDGYKRLLFPAIEREIRSHLTANAEAQAIHVFGVNLKQLLLTAPLAGHTVMGLDPGYRTGCKMAVVDATGRILAHGVLQVTKSEAERKASADKALALIQKHHVTLLSIGNGTASYETEEFAAKLIKDNQLDVHYLITNEAGASVYSASKLAQEELPDYDVTIRGAVSIARRIQDPLAELVKIDPQAIGVGQYQHDVDQKALASTLDATIETAVNHVGIDLNTASATLLKHISGITAATAKNIIKWRDENGRFTTRRQLLKVSRLGPAAYTQCAGFLRIADGTMPLDNTPVHPESYGLTVKILDKLGFSLADLQDKDQLALLGMKLQLTDIAKLAKDLDAGLPTVRDIIAALQQPGRDPRADLPAPLTRKAIVKLSDIKPGAIMTGTVRNITDFGAFVDIGIKTAGLVHISEISRKRIKHPLDVLSVGDIVKTIVINVDEKRGRIGLSIKQVPKESA